jgi:N-acetylneuraminic acid mutarotase
MKTRIQTLFLGLTLLTGVHQAAAAVLLSDDFNSNVLDTSKWSINTTPSAEANGTPMVVVTNQRCEITARGYLNTVADYDPSAPGGLLITGTWTFVSDSGSSGDLPWIVTRSSSVPTWPWGEISDGINFRISVTVAPSPSQFIIVGSGGAAVTGLNVVSNTLNLAQGDSVNFTITDDGTNLSFSMAKIGDPTQAASATAICTNHFSANKISFYNREYSSDTAALDNVVVQTLSLTNIVVSPANPVIGVSSNQQFTATGYYSDGSSQVLTNDGSGGSGTWTNIASMPQAVIEVDGVACGGKFYVMGGATGANIFSQVYDPTTDAWSLTAADPVSSGSVAAGVINNKIYVAEGWINSDANNSTTALEIYDPTLDSWSAGASSLVARGQTAKAVIGGKLYITDGNADFGSGDIATLEIYDPIANTWSTGAPIPVPSEGAVGASINGKFYVVGGYVRSSGDATTNVFIYDPTTDTWTSGASLPLPRNGAAGDVINGKLYITGGTSSSGMSNPVMVYDPVTDNWSAGAAEPTPRTLGAAAAIGGKLFVAGGYPNGTSPGTATAEVFTPQSSLAWSSSSPAVASIDTNGVATGLTNGNSTITATFGSVSGVASLTVVSHPAISLQPTNATVSPNGSVTLIVGASGGGLSYQWQFNGTNITGATGSSLTITNVSGNVGVYTVIVSNAAGSVTSTSVLVASVDIKMFAGVIVNGPLGSNYLIQATSNLPGGWTTLTNVALPSQPYIYIDYSSPTNRQQFYRAVPQ